MVTRHVRGTMRDVSAEDFPGPPKSSARENGASVRLTDEEDEELERAVKFLAYLWNKKKVKKSDVIRAALQMFFRKLEKKREEIRQQTDTGLV